MAIAIVGTPAQTDGNDSANSIATSQTSHSSGNLLVVCIGNETSGRASAQGIADTAGNSYSNIGVAYNNNDTFEIWYAKNITGHALNIVTATFNASATYRRITVFQFSGCDQTTPFVTGKYATGDGTTGEPTTSSSITPSMSDCVIVAGCMQSTSPSWSAGSDGQGHTPTLGPSSTYYATEYIIESSIAAYTMSIHPESGYGYYGMVAAAFNISGAGPLSVGAHRSTTVLMNW